MPKIWRWFPHLRICEALISMKATNTEPQKEGRSSTTSKMFLNLLHLNLNQHTSSALQEHDETVTQIRGK
jgi:hypothetical protein